MEKASQYAKQRLIKVVFIGPESTGKSTIADSLAKIFDTVWVPEYARDYLQNKLNNTGKICEPKDLLPIANGQLNIEKQYLTQANKFLFCDTNVLQTYIYARIYFPELKLPTLKKMALSQKYDLCFLTGIDVPWEPDDLRDRPDDRQEIYSIFKKYLTHFYKKFFILEGNLDERIKIVKQEIQNYNNAVKSR